MNPQSENSSQEEGDSKQKEEGLNRQHTWEHDETDEVVYEQSEMMEGRKSRGTRDKAKPNLLKTEKTTTSFDSGEWGVKLDLETKERAMEMEVQSQADKLEEKLKLEGRLEIEKETATRKTSFPVRDVKVEQNSCRKKISTQPRILCTKKFCRSKSKRKLLIAQCWMKYLSSSMQSF